MSLLRASMQVAGHACFSTHSRINAEFPSAVAQTGCATLRRPAAQAAQPASVPVTLTFGSVLNF